MIVLRIEVADIAEVLSAGMDKVYVYRDTSSDGSFALKVGEVTLSAGVGSYHYTDLDGDNTSWYKVSYYDVDGAVETDKSEPIKGIPSAGPLQLISINYLRANTDFPALAAMSDSKLAEYIWRAETLIQRWSAQYGGLDTTLPNYAIMMGIAARMIVEDLYIIGNPQARARRANGLQSERIGSYQYTVSQSRSVSQSNPYDFGAEALAIMYYYLLNKQTLVSMKTTQVFPELEAAVGPLTPAMVGVEIRPWHDFTDLQLSRTSIYGAWVEDPYFRYSA